MSYLIVGLGNPGLEYELSRHNTGRLILETFYKKASKDNDLSEWKTDKKLSALKSVGKIGKESVILLQPETMMNNSGKSLRELVNTSKKAEKLVVIYDDLDLPLGGYKISFNRGTGGHRGLESIVKNIKTKAFIRIRVGISPTTPSGKIRKPQGEDKIIDFILGKFKSAELEELKKIGKKIADSLFCLIEEGRERAMNSFN
jgi:peptidyl-tRNA hydrolase, PTH1 family